MSNVITVDFTNTNISADDLIDQYEAVAAQIRSENTLLGEAMDQEEKLHNGSNRADMIVRKIASNDDLAKATAKRLEKLKETQIIIEQHMMNISNLMRESVRLRKVLESRAI